MPSVIDGNFVMGCIPVFENSRNYKIGTRKEHILPQNRQKIEAAGSINKKTFQTILKCFT
jgi:hypothetical protein